MTKKKKKVNLNLSGGECIFLYTSFYFFKFHLKKKKLILTLKSSTGEKCNTEQIVGITEMQHRANSKYYYTSLKVFKKIIFVY